MGAKPSNMRQKAIVKEMESWPGFVERTCLSSSDLSTLAAAFRKACEVGENEYLERNDFEHWLEMGSKPSNLENRLFVVFSVTSPDQEVGLADFMVGIWNYCVDSKTNLSRLAFDIYDRNASGTITEADLEGMLVDVWGENWEDDERASALMAECAGTDPMEIDQWEKFCRGYPNLLHPIFKLQNSLQEATLGRKQWAKIGSKLQKREKALEEERARMLREAVTDEDKARVRAEIEAKLAEEAAIVGSRSHRIAAAKRGEGVASFSSLNTVQQSIEGLNTGPGGIGIHRASDSNTAALNLSARDRLKLARDRVEASSEASKNWDEESFKRGSKSKSAGEGGQLPKFSVTSRKVANIAAGFDGEGEDGSRVTKARTVATAGSAGVARPTLGSMHNNSLRQGPTKADAGRGSSDSGSGSSTSSPMGPAGVTKAGRIGHSHRAHPSNSQDVRTHSIGAAQTEAQRASKAPRPSGVGPIKLSGDLGARTQSKGTMKPGGKSLSPLTSSGRHGSGRQASGRQGSGRQGSGRPPVASSLSSGSAGGGGSGSDGSGGGGGGGGGRGGVGGEVGASFIHNPRPERPGSPRKAPVALGRRGSRAIVAAGS